MSITIEEGNNAPAIVIASTFLFVIARNGVTKQSFLYADNRLLRFARNDGEGGLCDDETKPLQPLCSYGAPPLAGEALSTVTSEKSTPVIARNEETKQSFLHADNRLSRFTRNDDKR